MKRRISLIFCVVAAVICLLSIGAAAATYAPDNDGLYTVTLDMEPNCEYSLFALKGEYDQTNYIEAYRASEDSDIIYFEQKNSENNGRVTFGPFAPAGYYSATLILGGTNLDEPIIAGYLSVDGVSNSASIVLSGIAQSYTVGGINSADIVVEIGAQVLDSFGYPSMTNEEVEFSLLNTIDGATIDGNVLTISKTAKQQVLTVKATVGDAVKTANVMVNRLEEAYTYIELYADEDCTQKLDGAIKVVGTAGNYPDVTVYAKSFSQYGDEMADEYVYNYGNKTVSSTFKPMAGTTVLTVNSKNSAVSRSVDVVVTLRPDYKASALELYNLIEECRQLIAEDKNISDVSGKDIFSDETWTTQAAVDTFSLAISNANTALGSYGSEGYSDSDYSDEVTSLTKALNTYKSSFKAGVRVDIETISLDITEAKLLPKDELDLRATTSPKTTTDVLTWTSSDEAVATVTAGSSGRATVKAKAEGTAIITVTTRAGLTATAEVTVVKKTTSITLSPYKATATYGSEPVVLDALINPKGCTDELTWTVEKPEVADISVREHVDYDGYTHYYVTVIPKSSGKTDITVSSAYGKHSATSEITVVMPNWSTAAAPVADVESGTVLSGTKVALSTATPNTKIYYTLDGSVPTAETGRLYINPITIETDFVLKAIAVGDELYNSEVAVYEYDVINTGVTVSSETARSGEEIEISINVFGFEDIEYAEIELTFDSSAITCESFSWDTNYSIVPEAVSDKTIKITYSNRNGAFSEGKLLNGHFKVNENATEGDYTISVTKATVISTGGASGNLGEFEAATQDGVITVNNYTVGDVNDDGKIGLADVLLLKQYLSGNEAAKRNIVLGAADTDADDDVDNDDLTLLSKYCVGWNVTLG